jgi:hypothetical protein
LPPIRTSLSLVQKHNTIHTNSWKNKENRV